MKRHLYIVQVVLILTLCSFAFAAEAQVKGVAVVGMTVSEMDRATDFYSALTFQKVSDVEVFGDEYEHLVGVFGARMRIVRMQLGNEFLETDKLFLGIDHTAIAVAHTDASLRFYSDLLGLRKAAESENYGTEQEHLNQIFGAHLRITSMRAGSGPGIEFLEYLTPRDGRPRQHDAKANDLIHWQTTLVTPDVEALARFMRRGLI